MIATSPQRSARRSRLGIRPRESLESRWARQHRKVCQLWHYQEGYPYQPDHEYTDFTTTDPCYVVEDVRLMAPSPEHGDDLREWEQALHVLVEAHDAARLICREVPIKGIPGAYFANKRNTGALVPDLTLWNADHPPDREGNSYVFDPDHPPLLVVEVVSHSTSRVRTNDLVDKMGFYARMGIQEYWILDSDADEPLLGFAQDKRARPSMIWREYREISLNPDGSRTSQVLGTDIRWQDGRLEAWDQESASWLRITDIPALESRREGHQAGQLGVWQAWLEPRIGSEAWRQLVTAWQDHPEAKPEDEQVFSVILNPHAWHLLLPSAVAPPDQTQPSAETETRKRTEGDDVF